MHSTFFQIEIQVEGQNMCHATVASCCRMVHLEMPGWTARCGHERLGEGWKWKCYAKDVELTGRTKQLLILNDSNIDVVFGGQRSLGLSSWVAPYIYPYRLNVFLDTFYGVLNICILCSPVRYVLVSLYMLRYLMAQVNIVCVYWYCGLRWLFNP